MLSLVGHIIVTRYDSGYRVLQCVTVGTGVTLYDSGYQVLQRMAVGTRCFIR
jgi:hypothetical protein